MMELKFPDLGNGISEGQVIKWLAKEGEVVQKSQNVLYVETFKTMIEIPATSTGKIRQQKCKIGDMVKAGDVIAVIDAD
ncbi:biotin/lipoyl-containing protein [Candidatus Uabimicrobium amorphum]|uniref:Dihydrolipoamide acetyltransferase component of pyruvate dehydrogenase complex n=1 Tax=Uabimicrobium amorphum TaxID=2596890 RepID=A0A5S9IQL0_UABAM|nr:biotin/lipoyl-containing protein [Candidatus Uabimicrobium amorphum]BBM85907.1 dihydrolipoamide acetyltransferase component of pyruvate dehydrogenase complex [Candidatus Uabimicrobium amorphum]